MYQEILSSLNDADAQVLDEISQCLKIYLIIPLKAGSEERSVKELVLERLPFMTTRIHYALFHETQKGKIAFVRQLKPHLHIDYDSASITELAPHVPHTVSLTTSVFKKADKIVAIRCFEDLVS